MSALTVSSARRLLTAGSDSYFYAAVRFFGGFYRPAQGSDAVRA